ncbi:exonuclease SbcC [Virgibacillus natechei]|uniref:Nuclease SbcCD subunit C n=2 Tax=Virgibacillus natechei TaxID=1216297 RepID=A0ABS4IDR2_9BACI|nr:exonuclease SbcC [Virgibacillus natechei]
MTAFGPFKHTESIDFRELKENNLFVISGNTGAGKTTIFDGICFALYGSASGTDREDTKMLRSDFAEDNTHTSIELEFELRGRNYRILRQLGHVKAGNKSKTGEKYEFFEKVDDKEIPCVDRQMVSEIDKKVEAIIGLTQDQFKQIVMLPQGEFRKLLTSETENKEAILRKIFKTESYKQMNERLRNKKDNVKEDFMKLAQKRDHYIQNIPAALPQREESSLFKVLAEEHHNVNQVIAGLEEETLFYHNQITIDQQNYDAKYKAHGTKQTEFYAAKTLNDRFQDLDTKEKELKELQEQVPAFKSKEKQLVSADSASTIEVYEKQAAGVRQEEKEKASALEKAKAAEKMAEETLTKAQAIYTQEENKKQERENASKKLDQLQGYLPVVKDIEARKKQLEELKYNENQTFKELENVKPILKEKNDASEAYTKQINELTEAVDQQPEKQEHLKEMGDQVNVLKDFLKLKEDQATNEKDIEQKEAAYRTIKSTYDQVEQEWMNNQASLLAAHLHDGESCPVCGSQEHPNKTANQATTTTKEQLEARKKELDEKDSQYRDAVAKHKTNVSQLKDKEEELTRFKIAPADAQVVHDQLMEKGKQLKAEVNTIKHKRDELKKVKETHEKENKVIKQLEAKKENLEKAYQEQTTSYQTAKAVYDERVRVIPEEVRVLSELEKQIKETEALKRRLEKAWEQAQISLQQAKEEQTKASANQTHTAKQLEETKERRIKEENRFYETLHDADFESEEAYQQAKIPEADRKQLKEAIQQFKEQKLMITERVNELRESLKDKSRVDVTAIETELAQLKRDYELALTQLNLSKDYHQETIDLKANISDANEQVKGQEKQLATITDLYDVLRGQNSQKISFERYLQIEYLEQIIEAANGRLKGLSNGQFYLIRSDRQESHGKQSGLGLDVYDAYTGQTRDVKTLSGGEKFNASLCLALGMSDVIQSFQGNISIETMFIDEGFGSLDEESLNKSIDTLIDLQQAGRTIGVISHVQELKSIFPAILEVSKEKEGYSKTAFLVK